MDNAAKSIVAAVDDDSRVLESLGNLLESAGYAPHVFESAKAFLDSGAIWSVGCLICDIRMPDMDGWELQAIVHRQRPDLPIILITGHDERTPARLRSTQGCAWTLFKKPFNGQELLATVTTLLDAPA